MDIGVRKSYRLLVFDFFPDYNVIPGVLDEKKQKEEEDVHAAENVVSRYAIATTNMIT